MFCVCTLYNDKQAIVYDGIVIVYGVKAHATVAKKTGVFGRVFCTPSSLRVVTCELGVQHAHNEEQIIRGLGCWVLSFNCAHLTQRYFLGVRDISS